MAVRLSFDDPEFESRFTVLVEAPRDNEQDVRDAVTELLTEVREHGLEAVLGLTRRFDRWDISEATLAFSQPEIDAAVAQVPEAERRALELAAKRIEAYHRRQMPEDAEWQDEIGATLGWRWRPVDAAGLYVPGGLASYPSSVLMNAIPARVAGVGRLVICAPTPEGAVNPLVLLAAQLAGIETVYRIGGAQAIGALAFGAGPIRPVDKITGPGNAYVAEAKRQVFGKVGIDMIAGPSEVLIIADAENDPDWLALDLMAQAEHDENAQSILTTDSADLADAVERSVDRLLQRLERRDIAGTSWHRHGAVIVVRDLDQAASLADRIAPEHLELCVADPRALAERIRHAGAIFLGQHTPEAVGDYVGGPNHVLPTAGSARFSSGLSVLDFMKRTTISGLTPEALSRIGPAAETLARSEGLGAHARSIGARLGTRGNDEAGGRR